MPKRQPGPRSVPPTTPESLMRDVQRMLSREQFSSIDDVNTFLEQLQGQPIGEVEPANDRERAEDLVLAARGERSASRRRRMLSDALALDADCLPAHVLLAEESKSPADALIHLGRAVAAGQRTLAPLLAEQEAFLWGDPVGRFWLIAYAQRAELRWQMGDRPQAIADARDVLRLNPSDNYGMRYVLLQWLMRAGSVADISELLASYDESSTPWLFTMALHRFRTDGPTAAATKALRAAHAGNRFVIPMLLGTHPMPAELPESYVLGGEDEATLYVESALTIWIDAVGAMEWAQENARVRATKQPPR